MKIAMIGSGAAGSVFASYLKKGGAELWLVDRYKAHMDKVASEGMTFVSPAGEEVLTGFHTAYSAEDIGVMDYVILMVKATQTDGIMPSVLPCIGESTVVVSLQNGIGNEDVLAKYVPADRILYGFGTIGTELPEPAKCVAKPESGVIMRFGAAEKGELIDKAGKALEQCFCDGGCLTRFEEDVRPFVWKKAISNSGYNTLAALTRLKVGEMLAVESGRELIRSVWAEGCDVCQALTGVDLWEDMLVELENLREGFASYYPSMAQDVLIHQRQTEIELLNGAIVKYGRELGIPTPVNSALVLLIQTIQQNYDKQYVKQ